MMSASIMPVVDPGNPMYCPEISAARYLRQLQQMRGSSRHLDHTFVRGINWGSCDSGGRHVSAPNHEVVDDIHPSLRSKTPPFSQATTGVKRKREDVTSKDLNAACTRSKPIRSDISQTSSFILNPDSSQPHFPTLLRAAPLQDSSDTFYQDLFKRAKFSISQNPSSPRHVSALERELYGYPIGGETRENISRLLEDLSRELPGISLTHQVSRLERLSHQDIVDLLAVNGHLARHILEYFRGSLIQRLDLSASLSDEEGLSVLKPQHVLDVFALPNSFNQLRELNLNRVSLDDFDLINIHHLPSLEIVWLNETGVGNEAVGHLTALKHQLKELHLEDNPRVDDDCIPSLCLFRALIILRMFGTSVQMSGLRKLAASFQQSQREIDVEIPQECDTYLNNLHSHYQLHPRPPLITEPRICTSLSVDALKANLAAHAAFNPYISLSGSQPELADRLQGILEKRLADRVVKEVVWGYESSNYSHEDDNETLSSDLR